MSSLFEFEFGLIIWQTVILLLTFFILGRYAWKPILVFIHKQEQSYAQAASHAEEQRKAIRLLENQREHILKETNQRSNYILQQALIDKKKLLEQATAEANQIKEQMLDQTQKDIFEEKKLAINKLKKQVGILTIQIAEKLLQRELSEPNKQDVLLQTLITQANTKQLLSHKNT